MQDPISFVVHLAEYVGSFESLLRSIVFVIGIVLVIQSLRLSVRRIETGAHSVSTAKVLMSFFVGSAMLAFPQTVSTLLATVFGSSKLSNPSEIFSYSRGLLEPIEGSKQAIEAIVLLIQLIGFIAIVRGLLFLNGSASPNAASKSLGPGITFIIAGALAVNFPAFFGMMTQLVVGSN